MSDTCVTDITHYLDEEGHIIPEGATHAKGKAPVVKAKAAAPVKVARK